MRDRIRVYYDFSYPTKGEPAEPGLYRRYFKYSRDELSEYVEPSFRPREARGIGAIVEEGVRKVRVRTMRLPFAACPNARGADLLHLFIRMPAFFNRPWVSECECIDQFARYFGYDARAPGFRDSLSRMLANGNFKRLVVNCQASARAFPALGVPSEKTIVSYPVVQPHLRKNHAETKSVNLLFNFGSNALFFSKGGREVIESFKALRTRYRGVRLTIVGNDRREKIPQAEGIEFHGFVPHAQFVGQILPAADILVHPTHMDSFGYVVLEGMAAGLPVVATNHYAIPEMIAHGINGFLVPDYADVWYDPDYVPKRDYRGRYHAEDRTFGTVAESRLIAEQMIAYLEALIANPDLRQRIGDANRELIAHGKFSPAQKIQRLVAIYRQSMEPC